MRIPGSHLRPESVKEVQSHLYETSRIYADATGQLGWSVANNDWPADRSRVYGYSETSWFRLDRRMAGVAARLGKHAGGSILLGKLDDNQLFGDISLNCDVSADEVSFLFKAEKADAEDPFRLAARGVYAYLQGYDAKESADIQRQVDEIYADERAQRDHLSAYLESPEWHNLGDVFPASE